HWRSAHRYRQSHGAVRCTWRPTRKTRHSLSGTGREWREDRQLQIEPDAEWIPAFQTSAISGRPGGTDNPQSPRQSIAGKREIRARCMVLSWGGKITRTEVLGRWALGWNSNAGAGVLVP